MAIGKHIVEHEILGVDDTTTLTSTFDSRYLKLTADNDPVTGQLDINVATASSSALVLKSTDDSLTNYLLTLKDSTSTDRFSVYSNGQATFSLPANVWDNDVAGVYIGTSSITDTTEKGFVTIVNDGTTSNTDPKRDSFAITRSGAANNINITNYASTPATADSRIFWRRARGTRGTPLAVASGDRVGAFIFSGHDGTNFLGQSGGWIAVVDGAVSTGVVPIAVRLETGTYFSARVIGLMQSSTGAVSVNSSFQLAATTVPLTLYGSASQSANLFQTANSSSTILTYINASGNVGVRMGATAATAYLHLAAGTTAASTAPIKLTSGTVMTIAEAGAIEFTTDDFFATITTGAARKAFVLDNGTRLTSGKVPVATTNGRLVDSTASTLITAGIPSIVASTFEKAETGTDANVLTYTTNASTDEYLVVQVSTDVSALTGTSVAVTVTWKDSNNATATSSITLSGVTDGSINVPINAFKNTSVVISTVFVGVSTAYNISAFIMRLK